MAASDNTSDIVSDYTGLLRRSLGQPEIAALPLLPLLRPRDPARPCALLLSPHPDDECLTGALPLRLKQEQSWQIVNIAVTLGSDPDRRAARSKELARACALLGFECVLGEAEGFSAVNQATQENNRQGWRRMVVRLAEILTHYQPQAVFLPHRLDAHVTHTGTHLLGLDALAAMPGDFSCTVIHTEYWQPLVEPNLMIGCGENDVASLLSALACHAGEVARNPYDARFPAYLIDNVRRGSELVGGKGVAAAAMDFAMLYRLGLWRGGKFMPSALNRIIPPGEPLGEIIAGHS
jgi:LmbE family N-acetylglucosaminyl deacetylase